MTSQLVDMILEELRERGWRIIPPPKETTN
jgi:hypothetical protein